MTYCIISLLVNCSHLKELFILSNITFHYQSYLILVFFQLSPIHFSDFYIFYRHWIFRVTVNRDEGYA